MMFERSGCGEKFIESSRVGKKIYWSNYGWACTRDVTLDEKCFYNNIKNCKLSHKLGNYVFKPCRY